MRLAIWILVFFCGCTSGSIDSKGDLLVRYLNDHNFSNIDSDLVVVLQTDACGSCTQEVLNLITSKLESTSCNALIILSEYDDSVVSSLSEIKNSTLRVSNKEALQRYGLRRSSDTVYQLEDGKVTGLVDLLLFNLTETDTNLSDLLCFSTDYSNSINLD